MEKDILKMEGSERRESKQTMKFMGAEKMDFVQRYIENVQETYSLTTEASDSGLGTRTAVSEEETEDVRGKTDITVVSVVIFNETMLTVTRCKEQRGKGRGLSITAYCEKSNPNLRFCAKKNINIAFRLSNENKPIRRPT